MIRDPEEIFYAALQISPDLRPGFLAEQSRDDPGLRARLQRMVDLVESKPHLLVPPGEAPDRVGRYEVLRRLGMGGIGVVYLARDPTLGREIALKLLGTPLPPTRDSLGRLHREAQLLASLKHPNIAMVHTFEEADGQCFFTMEHVEGETLAVRMQRAPLPKRSALEVCKQVADALVTAHSTGVAHLDLKPSNVMLSNGDFVKVLDFGIAELLNPSVERSGSGESDGGDSEHASEAPTVAGTSPRAGTPEYMSPEQAAGLPVDHRSDIYSFGCLLYECLTGKRYSREATQGQSRSRPVRLPSRVGSRRVRRVLAGCLEPDPSRRTESMKAIHADLVDETQPRRSRVPVWLTAVAIVAAGLAILWPVPRSCEWPEGGRLVFKNWLGIPVARPETGSRPGNEIHRGIRDDHFWKIVPGKTGQMPYAVVVWGSDEGQSDVLARLDWRGEVLETRLATTDPAVPPEISGDLRWSWFHLRRTREGDTVILVSMKPASGNLCLVRTFLTDTGLTEGGYLWHRGFLEYFPERDLDGDGHRDQLAMGWSQYQAEDGSERPDLPVGRRGRSVVYALDLDRLVASPTGSAPLKEIPPLSTPEASRLGLLTGWSFPLDGLTGETSSTCLAIRKEGRGKVRFSCYGTSVDHVIDYVLLVGPHFDSRVVDAAPTTSYHSELIQSGLDDDSIDRRCEELSQSVLQLRAGWEPVLRVD